MSTSETTRRNIPAPDELAEVRAEIERLKQREDELRALLIEHQDLRTGAGYVATVKTQTQQRTDLKELRAAYPKEVEEHTHQFSYTVVKLLALTEDGELVNPRKLKAEATQ